eukprot:7033228-Pyramimonas_sp.AAC.1
MRGAIELRMAYTAASPFDCAAQNGCNSIHVGADTGAFGGAPYGGTVRVGGVQNWCGTVMRARPLGLS